MTQLGKLSPKYRFILNPFEDVRFSTCPECSQRTLLRKVPLAVHVDPHHPILLNKHCRYCPDCDLLIAHKDEIERLLVITFEQRDSGVIGNDYLILGTVDKSTWRKQQKAPIPMGELIGYLHDFKEYLTLSYTPSGWYREDQPPVLRKTPPPPKPTAFTNPKLEESPLTNIIDDPRQVESLIKKMELLLPISAEIRRGPASYLRSRGSFIPPHRNIEIQNVFYAGDDGGIMCALSPKDSKEPVVISLTHLKIPYRHPLEKEIRAYQKARARKLK